jgi:integrase
LEQNTDRKVGAMSDPLPLDLTEYSASHRTRERRENGSVKLVGKREKKWEGSYHIYKTLPDGSTVREKRTRIIGTKKDLPTKAEAKDALRAWIRRNADQPVAETAKAKASDLADDYILAKKSGWVKETEITIRGIFKQAIKPAIGYLAIDQVQPQDLKRLVDNLPSRQKVNGGTGVSDSYAQKVIQHLRGMFDVAEERGLIVKNPARSVILRLKVPRQARRPQKPVFPPQYLPRLLAQMEPKDQLIVRISLLGGNRPNELFGLEGADVGPGWIHIRRSLDKWRRVVPPKSRSGMRYITIPPELDRDLHAYLV